MFRRRDVHSDLETVKVGPGETLAAWRLKNVSAMRRFLSQIVELRRTL
jgi:trehalose-6-phosphatase